MPFDHVTDFASIFLCPADAAIGSIGTHTDVTKRSSLVCGPVHAPNSKRLPTGAKFAVCRIAVTSRAALLELDLFRVPDDRWHLRIHFIFFIYHLMSLGSTGDQQTIKA